MGRYISEYLQMTRIPKRSAPRSSVGYSSMESSWRAGMRTSRAEKTLQYRAFGQLQKDIATGQIDTVVCWKLDRLARLMLDGIRLIVFSPFIASNATLNLNRGAYCRRCFVIRFPPQAVRSCTTFHFSLWSHFWGSSYLSIVG